MRPILKTGFRFPHVFRTPLGKLVGKSTAPSTTSGTMVSRKLSFGTVGCQVALGKSCNPYGDYSNASSEGLPSGNSLLTPL